MARKLPWLKKSSAAAAGPAKGAPKRRRVATPNSDEVVDNSGVSTPKKMKQRPARTQSTSPPAFPPPEKYMHEGFDKDDVYMMVEDQFQSIAQSFTQHLHKAEYRRLTEQAKKQKASTIRDIARPTDASTAMRTETRKMKDARELAGKQKAGIRETKSTARRSTPGADDDSDIEKDKADDPWVGTSLHGFMTSPKKSQQALVGLQGVKSKTRAAAGFNKSNVKSPMERRGLMDLDLSKDMSNYGAQEEPIEVDEGETTSGDEDDLDAMPSGPSHRKEHQTRVVTSSRISPVHTKSTDPDFFKKNASTRTKPPPQRSSNKHASTRDVEKTSNSRSKPVKRFAFLDDFDDLPSEPKMTSVHSQETAVQKPKSKAHDQGKREKAAQPTVVPTFLV